MEYPARNQQTFLGQFTQALLWLSTSWVCLQVGLGKYSALYIAGNIVWLVAAGGFVCFGIGMFQLTAALLRPPSGATRRNWGSILGFAVFLLPLALLLLVTPRAFGASTLHRSGGVVQMADFGSAPPASAATASPAPTIQVVDLTQPGASQPLPTPSEYGDIDKDGTWTPDLIQISLLLRDNPPEAMSRTLRTLGFIYRRDNLPPGSFVLTRYATIHCAAEAHAIGILVSATDAASYNEGDWVLVTGKVEQVIVGGKQQPQIKALTIQAAAPPINPYLFYNYYAPPAQLPNTTINRP